VRAEMKMEEESERRMREGERHTESSGALPQQRRSRR